MSGDDMCRCGHERREHEPECWICGQRGIDCDRFASSAARDGDSEGLLNLRGEIESTFVDAWRVLPEDVTVLGAGAFLADKILALPALRQLLSVWAVMEQVAAIHVPYHGYCVACDADRDTEVVGNNPDCPHHASFCASCNLRWPCPTRRALAGERT